MAPHMDPTLCRERLNALADIGLLGSEVRPNLRLFWSDGELEGMIEEALGRFLQAVGAKLEEPG